MQYVDLMAERHILFAGLNEPKDNALRLYFYRTTTVPAEPLVLGDQVYEGSDVVVDTEVAVIEVAFENYIGYSVRNESFTMWDETEAFEGHAFRLYTKSKYLDFVRAATFACDAFPGPFQHYGMACYDHVIDVVSASEPVVTEVAHRR